MSSVTQAALGQLANEPPGWRTREACPVCGVAGRKHLESKGYQVLLCPDCQHQWAAIEVADNHIEEQYSMDYFAGGGAGYANYLSEAEALRTRGAAYGRILQAYAARGGKLLDVGAAADFLSQGFRDTGWDPTALEPNPEMAQYGRRELGLTAETGSLEDNSLAQGTYDVVALIQVIAHFADPKAALAEASRLTKVEGGYWLVETWDSQSRVARTLGRHWHEYSPPSALHYFSRESLRRLAGQFSFVEIASGRPDKRIEVGHALSLVSYQLGEPRWLQWAKARSTGVTLPYPGDDVFWALYRRESHESVWGAT